MARRSSVPQGYSLIELVYVVAIVSVLAVLAVPHIHRARMTANEKAALATVRTILEAQALYFARHQTYGTLAELISETFVDDSLGGESKAGYVYVVENVSRQDFALLAQPSAFGVTGNKSYYADSSGVICYQEDPSGAGPDSPPVGK